MKAFLVSMGIGPKGYLQSEIAAGKAKYDEQADAILSADCILADEELLALLDNSHYRVHELFEELDSNAILDPLVKIISNHAAVFTAENFLEELQEKEAYQAIIAYVNQLIDVENYTSLKGLVLDIDNVKGLSKADQRKLVKALTEQTLVEKIRAENKRLNLPKIRKDLVEQGKALAAEYEFNEEETEIVEQMFNNLCDKYLKDFNQARKDLLMKLPAFFEEQLAAILEKSPHLVVVQNEKKRKPLVAGFNAKHRKSKIAKIESDESSNDAEEAADADSEAVADSEAEHVTDSDAEEKPEPKKRASKR
jgi:hypothetical protein